MAADMIDRTIQFYDRLLETYGDAPQAVGWSPAGQAARFASLAAIGELSRATVADFGCGRGDLYGWLQAHGGVGGYVGYDCHPRMLSVAQVRHPDGRFVLVEAIEQIEPADYVVCSGVFNLRVAESVRDQWRWNLQTLTVAWERATRGLALNCLTAYTPWAEQVPEQFYTDPSKLLESCLRLTRDVRLFHGDLPRNMTVLLRKGVPGA